MRIYSNYFAYLLFALLFSCSKNLESRRSPAVKSRELKGNVSHLKSFDMDSIKQSTEVKAWKFVKWDVKPLSTLRNSKVYLLRAKLNQGQKMSREEKNWLAQAVNTNTYFRTAVPLIGYCFDFIDVLKKYVVNQYGQWSEYYAPDKTSLRAYLYGRINQIVEV
jgi:hypothetical protein